MQYELEITPIKTYATLENMRKAISKTGDSEVRHIVMKTEEGRFFPLFVVNERILADTMIHFRWNVVGA